MPSDRLEVTHHAMMPLGRKLSAQIIQPRQQKSSSTVMPEQ
jgi:hypothetical protein